MHHSDLRSHNEHTATVTLHSLVLARWALILLLVAIALAQGLMPDSLGAELTWSREPLDVRPPLAVLMAWLSINVATRFWLASHDTVHPRAVGGQLLLDVAALTSLLALWGGAANPFTSIYFMPIILATQISAGWTLVLLGVSAVSFAMLFVWLPIADRVGQAFAGHVHGDVVALLACSALGAWLVHRITQSASRTRSELARLRDQTIQDQHLAALGTLAAGAAHELGTPLGTVNLLAAELPHMAADEQRSAIDTIKREVARCKDILGRMASPEVRVSALSARDAQPWFLCELQDELDDPEGVKLTVVATAVTRERAGLTTVARASLGQIVRELVANGAEACRRRPGSRGVSLRVDVDREDAIIEVEDDGEGIEPDVAAAVFDPFFTTKPEGQGMGLGLYLARAQLRQLGGHLELVSAPGRGTKVKVRVALRPADPGARSSHENL
ncbi:MAG: HAMP domain-containing histidine kinase [Deltaproteobacteria bacterium]|nr:HAMP domain-containing histidine kinase [Nannocystaceae bacterium]